MHASVMTFLREAILPEEIRGKDLLEVGAQDVNGSPREVLIPYLPKTYIGIDFGPGRGVDIVMDVKFLVQRFGQSAFDVVVSTEMLEHAQDWRMAVDQMKAVLRPKGRLILTTRGPGFPFHGFPHDYWRFTVQDFKKIFADMNILHLTPDPDPASPGVLLIAFKEPHLPKVDLSTITVAGVA